jgi:hypothetical protein
MQDPIRSSPPTMTVDTTEARATLELPVEEIPEDKRTARGLATALHFLLESL